MAAELDVEELSTCSPAPWKWIFDAAMNKTRLIAADGSHVLVLPGKVDVEEADAQLIERAPEVLAGLIGALPSTRDEVALEVFTRLCAGVDVVRCDAQHDASDLHRNARVAYLAAEAFLQARIRFCVGHPPPGVTLEPRIPPLPPQPPAPPLE